MKVQNISFQAYIEILQSQGQYWFLKETAMAQLGISENAFIKASHRLISKNKLVRIQGTFYVIVPPEHRAVASLPASWFIHDLMQKIGQPYYVGLLTAAGIHGATHQQAMAFQVITTKPLRKITAGRVRIQFCHKKSILSNFYCPVKTASGAMHVSTPEMTAFDLVRYSHAAGEMQHVATVLSELMERLDPKILQNYIKSDAVEIATTQRLLYLLDMLKCKIDLAPLETELKHKKPVKRLLVSGSNAPVVEYNKRWKILVNELLEPDDL